MAAERYRNLSGSGNGEDVRIRQIERLRFRAIQANGMHPAAAVFPERT
jgi:hypothetical protein